MKDKGRKQLAEDASSFVIGLSSSWGLELNKVAQDEKIMVTRLSYPQKLKTLPALRALLCTLLVLILALTAPHLRPAHAATIAVDTLNDTIDANGGVCAGLTMASLPGPDGKTSLREAICAANTDAGADAITLPAGTYTLALSGANEDGNATGDLDIMGHLTLNGAGAASTIINGGRIDRVLHIFSGVVVEINGVTITNGSTGIWGGGIYNSGGTLTLNNSIVSGNTAGGSGAGGGILNNSGTLTLNNSAVSSNTADYGGGIHSVYASAVLTLNNSAVSGNTAGGKGGGIYNYDGTLALTNSTVNGNTAGGDTEKNRGGGGILSLMGTLALTNSTVSGNTVDAVGGGGIHNYGGTLTLNNVTIANNATQTGDGGGINNFFGIVNLRNTIVAGNSDVVGGEAPDCSGALTSQGYNVLGNNTGCTFTSTTGDQAGIDPLLGPLQDNGGNTFTHALPAGSPAIDAGNPATPGSGGNACAVTDQRGQPRPMDGNNDGPAICDIGAYEASGSFSSTVADFTASPLTGQPPLTVVFTDTSTGPINIWQWDFGDGTLGSTLQNPTHTYSQTGVYTVTLTVNGPGGSDVETKPNYITVTDGAITGLMASNDGPTILGQTTRLTASVTTGDNVTYAWGFGDGTTGTGANPTHTYQYAGDYTALVTATNSSSAMTATTNVTVLAENPETQQIFLPIIMNYIVNESPPVMHVADLDGVSTPKETKWFATVTITVLDGNQDPVATAKVFGLWSYGESVACETDSNGQCSLISEEIEDEAISAISFTVDDVTREEPYIAYDATTNTDPDGDSDGTTITVPKP
ncbi:MAG: PKD domain-containing protein [Anaerolineae bacterium]